MASQVTDLAGRTQSVGTRQWSLERWGPAVGLPALLLSIAMGLLAQVTPVSAATVTVCQNGGQYATIQAAVDAAAAGDVIQICTGTYAESVNLPDVGRDITLEAAEDAGVAISPASGPAVYADNGPYAGSISLINLTASSPDSLVLDFSAGIAGNLVISGSSVSGGSFAGLSGWTTGQIWITNTVFADNGWTGADIQSERSNIDCAIPEAIPLTISLYGVEASGNTDEGIRASTRCGNIVVDNSSAHDNGKDGFLLSSYETNSAVIISASSADDNGDPLESGGSGFTIESNRLTMYDTSATGNATDGVTRVGQAPTLLSAQSGESSLETAQGNVPAGRLALSPAGVAALPWTVEISNTSALRNNDNGINVGGVDFVTITHVSAIGNGFDGIRLAYAPIFSQGLAAAAVGQGMTGYITGALVMSNVGGIEFNDLAPLPLPGGQQNVAGAAVDAVGTAVGIAGGSIICDNLGAGVTATGNITHTYDARFNYWGSYTGPFHSSKNPNGTGDAVVDAAHPSNFNGVIGDVVFEPWVNGGRVASMPAAGVVGQTQVVSVVFGADQAAALAQGPGNPNDGPLFTVTTNNGVVTSTFGSGSTAPAAIGAGQMLTVALTPAVGGTANITVTGPCGLAASGTFPVVVPSISVTKSVGLDPNLCAPAGSINPPSGSPMYYCLRVTNSGNITLTDHLVSDPMLGITNVPLSYALAPGASVAITRSLVSGLGPITVSSTVTNAATITSTAVLAQFGGVTIAPQLQVTARAAGVVTVRITPTGLEPIAEPIGDKRVYLPALGR